MIAQDAAVTKTVLSAGRKKKIINGVMIAPIGIMRPFFYCLGSKVGKPNGPKPAEPDPKDAKGKYDYYNKCSQFERAVK